MQPRPEQQLFLSQEAIDLGSFYCDRCGYPMEQVRGCHVICERCGWKHDCSGS